MNEWERSEPDFTVFIPDPGIPAEQENQHFNVVVTPSGSFLAFWTQGSSEAHPDQRTVMSRSTDCGKTWSPYQIIDGPKSDDPLGTGLASWEFPIVATGVLPGGGTRIWCFYTKNIGIQDVRISDTGVLRCRWSDDDGLTWSDDTCDYPIARTAIGHPDPNVPPTWICYQTPTITPEGAVLAPITHWASNAVDDGKSGFVRTSEVWFLRFENILSEHDPDRLIVTTWPGGPDGPHDHGIQVPDPARPSSSVAQEATFVALTDGRLFSVFRTMTGRIWFAVSADDGRSWNEPLPLRYDPDGTEEVLNPIAPCPLYQLSDGRFLLVFYNNDGTANGGTGPADGMKNRTPAWYTVGVECDDPDQPVRFGRPQILAKNDMVPAGPHRKTGIATYTSYFVNDGVRYFWYPDRKHYLLGKIITDEMLDRVTPE